MAKIRVRKDGPEVSLRLETGQMKKLRPGDEVEVSDAQAIRLLGMAGGAFEDAAVPAEPEAKPAKKGRRG